MNFSGQFILGSLFLSCFYSRVMYAVVSLIYSTFVSHSQYWCLLKYYHTTLFGFPTIIRCYNITNYVIVNKLHAHRIRCHLPCHAHGCTNNTCMYIFIYIQIPDVSYIYNCSDRLCGIVVRVPGYRSRGPGSIPAATRFSEK
jgi:hypothetical protein